MAKPNPMTAVAVVVAGTFGGRQSRSGVGPFYAVENEPEGDRVYRFSVRSARDTWVRRQTKHSRRPITAPA